VTGFAGCWGQVFTARGGVLKPPQLAVC
jgi:hypothetical protein